MIDSLLKFPVRSFQVALKELLLFFLARRDFERSVMSVQRVKDIGNLKALLVEAVKLLMSKN